MSSPWVSFAFLFATQGHGTDGNQVGGMIPKALNMMGKELKLNPSKFSSPRIRKFL